METEKTDQQKSIEQGITKLVNIIGVLFATMIIVSLVLFGSALIIEILK